MTPLRAPAVEFYFEFSSPYAYFASERIETLCATWGLPLLWKPVMLGAIMKHTGQRPLFTDGVRGKYAVHDCLRWSRMNGIPFQVPDPHPVNSLQAARGALVLEGNPARIPFIHACFRAYWANGLDISRPAVIDRIVAKLGLDVPAFRDQIEDPAVKGMLKHATDAAWARGVFGTPTFVFGDEMLWGNDRLPVLEALAAEQAANARVPELVGLPV